MKPSEPNVFQNLTRSRDLRHFRLAVWSSGKQVSQRAVGRSRDLGKKIVCVLLISRPKKSATMSQNIQVVTEHFVNVTVTSNTTSFGCQKRFSKDLTIGALKVRLLFSQFFFFFFFCFLLSGTCTVHMADHY